MARLLKFKIKAQRPRRPAAILLVGGKKDYRVAVCRKLVRRYGFAWVAAREQLA